MYKTIIVPIDPSYSERAKPMLDIAAKFHQEGARVILLTVIEEVPSFISVEIPEDVLERGEKEVVQILKQAADQAPFAVEIMVHRGHPANRILDTAETEGADLIVIHSHRPGWEDYLIGSTAARVVRHAKCSVHVLR